MESVDVFPTTPLQFQVLEEPTSADMNLFRPFECYIDQQTNRMQYRMMKTNKEMMVHMDYVLKKIGSGRTRRFPVSWRKVDRRMRRVPKKTKKHDVTLCFRYGDTFVTKNLFTFGIRTASGDDIHLFQTLVNSAVTIYLPKRGIRIPTSGEATFICASEDSYRACVLHPKQIYRVENTTYVLVTQDKNVFSIHRCSSAEADAIETSGILPFVYLRSEPPVTNDEEEEPAEDVSRLPATASWVPLDESGRSTEDLLPDPYAVSLASCQPMERTVRWNRYSTDIVTPPVPAPPKVKSPYFNHVFCPPFPSCHRNSHPPPLVSSTSGPMSPVSPTCSPSSSPPGSPLVFQSPPPPPPPPSPPCTPPPLVFLMPPTLPPLISPTLATPAALLVSPMPPPLVSPLALPLRPLHTPSPPAVLFSQPPAASGPFSPPRVLCNHPPFSPLHVVSTQQSSFSVESFSDPTFSPQHILCTQPLFFRDDSNSRHLLYTHRSFLQSGSSPPAAPAYVSPSPDTFSPSIPHPRPPPPVGLDVVSPQVYPNNPDLWLSPAAPPASDTYSQPRGDPSPPASLASVSPPFNSDLHRSQWWSSPAAQPGLLSAVNFDIFSAELEMFLTS